MQHVVSVGIAPSDAYQAHMLPYLSSELGKVEGVVQRANHKRMTWLPHALAVRERADSMGRDSATHWKIRHPAAVSGAFLPAGEY